MVTLPKDIKCEDCTLQLSYEAPGYGIMYQCSDISIVDESEGSQCQVPCENNGVCQDGRCYCAAGYFGGHCENIGKPNQFYEAIKEEPIQEEPIQEELAKTNSKFGSALQIFGMYFIPLLISFLIAAIL